MSGNGRGTWELLGEWRVSPGFGVETSGDLHCGGSDMGKQLHSPDGDFEQVSLGSSHGCAITADGGIRCWGKDARGQASPF